MYNKLTWRHRLLLIPSVLFIAIFTFYPIVKMVVMSFFDWQIGFKQVSPFIGLANYQQVLSDDIAWIAIVNTFAYMLVTVPLQMAIGLFVASLLNRIRRFSVLLRLGYYLPVVTSWVIVAMLFKYIFNNIGLLNYLITDIVHLTSTPIGWLSSRWSALAVAMALGVWKGIGWNMVIFLAALQAVPRAYYEVAELEGATPWQQFVFVTLPAIRGTLLFVSVMLCIGAFNTYTPIAVLTDGNPAHLTEVILTWMYHQTFGVVGKMGYAAALSVIVTLIIVMMTYVIFRLSREESSL